MIHQPLHRHAPTASACTMGFGGHSTPRLREHTRTKPLSKYLEATNVSNVFQCPTWPTGICTSGQSDKALQRILRNLSPNLGDHLGSPGFLTSANTSQGPLELTSPSLGSKSPRMCQDMPGQYRYSGIAGSSCTTFRPSWSAIRSKAA